MKERVLLFSDAIIAIILTIIVLELPIDYLSDGTIKFPDLLRSIGIYFISFCFVANLWFQTAYAFNRVEKIKNNILVVYLMLLFLLSLIPAATRLLIEDTTRQTIVIYGVLSLIVILIMRRLILALTNQATIKIDDKKVIIKTANRRDMFTFFYRVLLVLFSYFFIYPALILYLILPIFSFLQNIVDREEEQLIESLHQDQQEAYLENRSNVWGGQFNRYSHLLRNSLKDGGDDKKKSDYWEDIMKDWEKNINEEIKRIEDQLKSNKVSNRSQMELELKQLYHQRGRLQKRSNFVNKPKPSSQPNN